MVSDQQVSHAFPREDVESVIPLIHNPHEGHDESEYRTRLKVADNLPLAVKCDIAILGDVAKLPRRAATCFHLDGDMPTGLIRCDDVVVGDVPGESGSDQRAAGEFRCNEVLAGLSDQFVASSCCHLSAFPNNGLVWKLEIVLAGYADIPRESNDRCLILCWSFGDYCPLLSCSDPHFFRTGLFFSNPHSMADSMRLISAFKVEQGLQDKRREEREWEIRSEVECNRERGSGRLKLFGG